MPRRTSSRAITSFATTQSPQQLQTPYDANIHQLHRHWKWAAFSQFFFTFNHLIAMSDVTLADVENDLLHSTNQVLSRVMQRLLITLTQDRKITAESWQNVLRRQYQRRDPEASPIGLVGRSRHGVVNSSRTSAAPPGTILEAPSHELECENELLQFNRYSPRHSSDSTTRPDDFCQTLENISAPKVEEEEDTLSEIPESSEKQVDWSDLSMLAKLDSLYTLAEWQFQNPHRLRQQMKTDDEQAAWRIEPIGYDSKRNAYWLIGGDRLWIQREPPRSNLKRKRNPSESPKKTGKQQPQSRTAKRQRTGLHSESSEKQPMTRSTRGRTQARLSPSGPREGRAAKTRANQRLDAQAKDLAEFRQQMASSRSRISTTRKPTGIRVSARLRGTTTEDDQWQEIPDEWLIKGDTHQKDSPDSSPSEEKQMGVGLESDYSSISELTELSDGENDTQEPVGKPEVDMEETAAATAEPVDEEVKTEDEQDGGTILGASDAVSGTTDDFVEWETICVTLEEWEGIAGRFEKATHYAEKALYKVLSQSIVPMVIADLREVEKRRQMEDAVVHRKRSSRIAMKEIEKEEERAAMRKRAEDDEKTSRARRLEARQQKEQAERLKRENAREQRRKERELREQQADQAHEPDSTPDDSVDIVHERTSLNLLPAGQSQPSTNPTTILVNGTGSGSRSPVENWELDCEVCGRRGTNQDDGVPLLCCGVCGRWQHIICHDKQDALAGRPRRNWETEEFICRRCRPIASKSSSPGGLANFASFGASSKWGQASSTQAYYGQASGHPRSDSNGGYYRNLPSDTKYPYNRLDIQTLSHSQVPQIPSTGVTFAHYQPQQGGFSTSRPTYSVQDTSSPQHTRYSVAHHATSVTGISPYPSTFHTQPVTHSSTYGHEHWPSYPRTTNSYSVNGSPPLRAQGTQPYYNGHAHTPYSQMREVTNPTMLRQYTGFQPVSPYQQSK